MPTEEHTPRIYTGGGSAWVRCNCGWKSDHCAGTQDASFQWSEHVAALIRAQLKDRSDDYDYPDGVPPNDTPEALRS